MRRMGTTSNRDLILYSTEGCTICDKVLDLLLGMPEAQGYRLRVVDVAFDDRLLARYGERLPVLVSGERELAAPIERSDLAVWLAG